MRGCLILSRGCFERLKSQGVVSEIVALSLRRDDESKDIESLLSKAIKGVM